MAVVINDFELVTEAPQSARPAPAQGAPSPQAAPSPDALERELARLAQRGARLRAD